MGDQGPWIRHLGAAWQAAAVETPDVDTPSSPAITTSLDERIAYWAPVLHLLIFGLGWQRPDLGLQSWRRNGWPLENQVLRVVHRWWGEDRVLDLLAWMAMNGGLAFDLTQQSTSQRVAHPPRKDHLEDSAEFVQRRRSPEWQWSFGGGSDALHLTQHLDAPVTPQNSPSPTVFDNHSVARANQGEIPRLCIVRDVYVGWYADFWHCQPGLGHNDRSVRTEVVVRPVGWLGEFRQHRTSRLWFRGRASEHMWGQESA